MARDGNIRGAYREQLIQPDKERSVLRIKMTAAGAIALNAMVCSPASAYLVKSQCYEPEQPYCLTSAFPPKTKWEFDQCRSEVEAYQKDMVVFIRCIGSAAQRETDAVVEKYNCLARGGRFCL